MKKIITLAALVLTLNFNANAQAVQKGNSIIDIYYGFPNLYGAAFKTLVEAGTTNINNVTSSSLGPMGGKYEYLLSNLIGLGVDFNYSNYTVKYQAASSDQNGNPTVYHYNFNTPAIRAMIACNFHVVHGEKIDFYVAVKTGYYSRSFAFTSDDPSYAGVTFKNFIPIAFRAETGIRYFFIPNVGIHVNVGLGGGPLAAGGVSFKF